MKVLTLNCGSSSVKFSFLETSSAAIARAREEPLLRGVIERIGRDPSFLKYKAKGESVPVKETVRALDYDAAIEMALKIVSNVGGNEITAVGHRVVHGGPKLGRSRLVDTEVESLIEDAIELAPLHNPHNLRGIQAVKRLLPGIPNVVAFDTGFHKGLPDFVSTYGLPSLSLSHFCSEK